MTEDKVLYNFRLKTPVKNPSNENNIEVDNLVILLNLSSMMVAGSEFSILNSKNIKIGLMEKEKMLHTTIIYDLTNEEEREKITVKKYLSLISRLEKTMGSTFIVDNSFIKLNSRNIDRSFLFNIFQDYKSISVEFLVETEFNTKNSLHELDGLAMSTLFMKPFRNNFSLIISIVNNYSWAINKLYSYRNANLLNENEYKELFLSLISNYLLALIGFFNSFKSLKIFLNEIYGKNNIAQLNSSKEKFLSEMFGKMTFLKRMENEDKNKIFDPNDIDNINKIITSILPYIFDENREKKLFEFIKCIDNNEPKDISIEIIKYIFKNINNDATLSNEFLKKIIFGYKNLVLNKIHDIKANYQTELKRFLKQKHNNNLFVLKLNISEQFNLFIFDDLINLFLIEQSNFNGLLEVFLFYTSLVIHQRYVFEILIKEDINMSLTLFLRDYYFKEICLSPEKINFILVGNDGLKEITISFYYFYTQLLKRLKESSINSLVLLNNSQGNNVLVMSDYILTEKIISELKKNNILVYYNSKLFLF